MPTTELSERFWQKVSAQNNGCWVWKAQIGNHGYGVYTVSTGVQRLAHRVSYHHFIGQIGEGLELDHLCRNRKCINPCHLEAVTHRVNSQRGDTGQYLRRRSRCIQGHEYTNENTYRYPDGRRSCRICRSNAMKEFNNKRLSSANSEKICSI